jgi:predicted lysophospholipase L1 biosynthesis ABC-type transport system permease subunit
MRDQKSPILTIAFAVMLLAFAALIAVSAVDELMSKGSCTTGATIKVWQGDFEFSHSCVRKYDDQSTSDDSAKGHPA